MPHQLGIGSEKELAVCCERDTCIPHLGVMRKGGIPVCVWGGVAAHFEGALVTAPVRLASGCRLTELAVKCSCQPRRSKHSNQRDVASFWCHLMTVFGCFDGTRRFKGYGVLASGQEGICPFLISFFR